MKDSQKRMIKLTINDRLVKFCAFFVLIGWQSLFAVENNQTVVEKLLREAAATLDRQLKEAGSTGAVALRTIGLDYMTASFMQQQMGNELHRSGRKVIRNFTTDSTFEGAVVELTALDVVIVYSRPQSSGFFSDDSVQRRIVVQVEGQVFAQPGGKVLAAVKIEQAQEDRIKYKEIVELEQSPYSFSKGVRAGLSSMDKIIEPALIVSGLAVIFYLFFSQRG